MRRRFHPTGPGPFIGAIGRGTAPTPVNCEGGCVTHGRSTQPARPASAHIPEATVRHPVPPWGIRIADCLTDLIPGDRASCPSHDPFRTGRGLDPHNRKPRHGFVRSGGVSLYGESSRGYQVNSLRHCRQHCELPAQTCRDGRPTDARLSYGGSIATAMLRVSVCADGALCAGAIRP